MLPTASPATASAFRPTATATAPLRPTAMPTGRVMRVMEARPCGQGQVLNLGWKKGYLLTHSIIIDVSILSLFRTTAT